MEIKIKYIFKNELNEFKVEIFTLVQIEHGDVYELFVQIADEYELIAKCRFTGLPDKNNTEIYEGDIVKSWIFVDELPSGETQWEECEKPYVINWINEIGGFDLNEDKYEIIGNIYENPELLESE